MYIYTFLLDFCSYLVLFETGNFAHSVSILFLILEFKFFFSLFSKGLTHNFYPFPTQKGHQMLSYFKVHICRTNPLHFILLYIFCFNLTALSFLQLKFLLIQIFIFTIAINTFFPFHYCKN